MAFLKTAVSFLLIMLTYASNSLFAAIPAFIPEPKSEAELYAMEDTIKDYPLNEEITVIRRAKLTSSELRTVIALQGIVAKTKPSVFIDQGNATSKYTINELSAAGYTLSHTDSEGNEWSFSSIIKKFAHYITDNGYVLYSTIDDHGQINTATNYSTLYGWLAVPAEVEETVISLGLVKKADISNDVIDNAYLKKFYNTYKKDFRDDLLIHQYSYAYGLRDLAIQQNAFVVYVDDSDWAGRIFRNSIFRNLKPASMILGWCQYEVKFTQMISMFGHYVIPSDHSYNVSLLASFEANDGVIKQTKTEPVTLDPTKHYVAIVYSDGDNAQWIQNGFSEYHTWQNYNNDIPVTWTFQPHMRQISTVDINRTLDNNKNATFVTGPSGAGYARITFMTNRNLKAFSDLTASSMLKTGITTVTLLDELDNDTDKNLLASKLRYFARYDNIHGGLLQLDPDYYGGGQGEVFFVNNKPFVSVRHSLWYPSGNAAEVTNEWLKEQADIVNSYPADINSINGFSVINVHPWTVGPDDLAYFVSCLDEDVVIITADQMIDALTRSIPHENAKPE